MTYSGMMTATTGSILVLMKKNSASLVFFTGRSESANAAGMPSSRTMIVDIVVTNSEFSSAVPTPASKTALNWSSVGVKKNVGGLVAASLSCLNAVSTIQATGKKNPMAMIQVKAVSRLPPRLRRFLMSLMSVCACAGVLFTAVDIRLPPLFR